MKRQPPPPREGAMTPALRRLAGFSGRYALWTVLALAAGAALLMSYVQTAQAQRDEAFTVEVVHVPDPLVAGDPAGAELFLKISYVPISTVTNIAVSDSGSVFTSIATTTIDGRKFGEGKAGKRIGFRSPNPADFDTIQEGSTTLVIAIGIHDLACDDLTATPIICWISLGSDPVDVLYADHGVSGKFAFTAQIWGAIVFAVHEAGDIHLVEYEAFEDLSTTVTVALTAPPTAEPIEDLSAERGSGEVALRWSDPGDANIIGYQYRYKVREDEYGDWTDIADSGGDTTEHTVTGLVNGRRHTFQIRPVGGEPSNEVTATPVRSRPDFDDFDDPDQPPEPPLPPPPDRTSAFLESGGTLRSQPLSPSRPVRATVQSPSGGFVAITVESNEQRIAPPGYTLVGSTVDITAPMATADDPLVLTFEVRTMVSPESLAVLRDGVAVEECTGLAGVADPDPCVSSRATGNGTAVLTVLTSQASEWQFGVALEPGATATPTPPPPATLTPTPPPTATPPPGPTATPTATPRPTATPTPPPTSTPIPTATPRPTSTPTPAPVAPQPQPTSTPVPPMDDGGLGAGLIALIVGVAVVIVGVVVFILRRR